MLMSAAIDPALGPGSRFARPGHERRESILTRTGRREGGIEKRIVKRKLRAIVDGR